MIQTVKLLTFTEIQMEPSDPVMLTKMTEISCTEVSRYSGWQHLRRYWQVSQPLISGLANVITAPGIQFVAS